LRYGEIALIEYRNILKVLGDRRRLTGGLALGGAEGLRHQGPLASVEQVARPSVGALEPAITTAFRELESSSAR
jgi:hypothetical protein